MRLLTVIVLALGSSLAAGCVSGQPTSGDARTNIVATSRIELLPSSGDPIILDTAVAPTEVAVNGCHCGWCWYDFETHTSGCEDCQCE